MAQKIIPPKELSRLNIIGVKVIDHKRTFKNSQGGKDTKTIKRTKYLKICWMCGSPYESNRVNSFACCSRSSQNIWLHRRIYKKNTRSNGSINKGEKYKEG